MSLGDPRRTAMTFLTCLLVLAGTPLGLGGCAHAAPPAAVQPETFEQLYGFRVEGVKLASAGYMLDFRFRVSDPELAWKVFGNRAVRPILEHPASGAKLIVPSPAYVGRLAPSQKPKPDRTYFIFFANPGRLVKSGDTVKIVVGEVEIGPLTVR
jgi:hypothetical protein